MQRKEPKRQSLVQTPTSTHQNICLQSTLPGSSQHISINRSRRSEEKQLRWLRNRQDLQVSSMARSRRYLHSKKEKSRSIGQECQQNLQLFSPSGRKSPLNQIQKQCRLILAKQVRAPTRVRQVELQGLKRSKTTQQTYEDEERQVANQLITEGMKERKHFERTLSKFNRLIERAARSYLDRNSININPYRLKGQGARKLITQGQVCNRYCDQVFEYEKYAGQMSKSIETNKEDVYTLLKSTNKVINIERVNQDLKKFNEGLKLQLMMHQSTRLKASRKGNQLLYSHYFRNSQSRKRILLHSRQAF